MNQIPLSTGWFNVKWLSLRHFLDKEEKWEEHLERMAKNGEWGTQIELIAMADTLGITILVSNDSPDEENFQVWVNWYRNGLTCDFNWLLCESLL